MNEETLKDVAIKPEDLPELQQLPQNHLEAWAQSMLMYQRKLADIDALKTEIQQLRYTNKCQVLELETLGEKNTILASDLESARVERDAAMRAATRLEAILESVQSQVNAFDRARSELHDRIRRVS